MSLTVLHNARGSLSCQRLSMASRIALYSATADSSITSQLQAEHGFVQMVEAPHCTTADASIAQPCESPDLFFKKWRMMAFGRFLKYPTVVRLLLPHEEDCCICHSLAVITSRTASASLACSSSAISRRPRTHCPNVGTPLSRMLLCRLYGY
jgi:hypothetical protein